MPRGFILTSSLLLDYQVNNTHTVLELFAHVEKVVTSSYLYVAYNHMIWYKAEFEIFTIKNNLFMTTISSLKQLAIFTLIIGGRDKFLLLI